jgi:hypothetical protein
MPAERAGRTGLRHPDLVAWLNELVDPRTTLMEILFGLLMALTFTLGAGLIVQDEGREGARQILVAALGCNLAWGIIDAAFYMVGTTFGREQLRKLGWHVRRAADEESAARMLGGQLDELLSPAMDDGERHALYLRLARNLREHAPAAHVRPRARDWRAAGIIGLLVFLAAVPTVIPFALLDDAVLAMRCSNAILLAILFTTGYAWARYTTLRPLVVGTSFVLGGTALVLIAIPLGG